MCNDIKYLITRVTIQPWALSQLCMGCEHGEFLDSKTFNSSNYVCFKNSMDNDGINCPLYEEEKNEAQNN